MSREVGKGEAGTKAWAVAPLGVLQFSMTADRPETAAPRPGCGTLMSESQYSHQERNRIENRSVPAHDNDDLPATESA